jgi:hypothetical protein
MSSAKRQSAVASRPQLLSHDGSSLGAKQRACPINRSIALLRSAGARLAPPTSPRSSTRLRAHSCTAVRIQLRYSLDVGRKSRSKRERRDSDDGPASLAITQVASDSSTRFSAVESAFTATRGRPARPRHVGARVARVAVDDATWAAFRELCGETPASIRLGQLVEADVQRARVATAESDAVAAVRAIRAHAEQLEAFIRASNASGDGS